MADCGIPLPCESTISSASDALKITNSGAGAAIAASATGNLNTALTAESTNGAGVTTRSNTGDGIIAFSSSNHGVRALSGSNHAVYALSVGASGFVPPASGVFGESSTGHGVVGSSASSVGVMGRSDTDDGVVGTSGTDVGVIGESVGEGQAPFGVVGTCRPGTGVFGLSDSGRGVHGFSSSSVGVAGTVNSGTGVLGNSPSGTGVGGTSLDGVGVSGDSSGGFISAGVFGTSSSGFISAGVFGISSAHTGIGVYGRGGEAGWAAFLEGKVEVSGSLIKAGGGFKIDHPLEPAHKYLSHSFVESPEMKNVYDGVVVLDNNGECSVELPEWFEALNSDFRYQLTSIGEPAPNLHVAREISNNRFNIAGGKPGMKVSWQVTGIRKDAWSQANPLIVEEEKPANERGYYRHPELYSQPRENSTFWKGNTELIRQLEERPRDLSTTEVNQVEEQVRYLTEKMRRHKEQQGPSST